MTKRDSKAHWQCVWGLLFKADKEKKRPFFTLLFTLFFGLHFCCKEVNLPADGTTVLLCILLPLQVHDGKYVAKREGASLLA